MTYKMSIRFFLILLLTLVSSLFVVHNSYGYSHVNSSTYDVPNNSEDYLTVVSNTEGSEQTLHLSIQQLLFNVTPHNDENGKLISLSLKLKPELNSLYKDLGFFDKPSDTVFIYPSFTQAAYGKNGFYDYYNKKCDTTCLTVNIPTGVHGIQASSIAGALVLKSLNYAYLKDEDVDKNPAVLKQFKKVIILHNEYVTKKEFDAITSHTNVVFLYPNALYAEVSTDYNTNTITLVKGHGYPNSSFKNGFDWDHDNSRYEYDVDCSNWYFYTRGNSTMLNCYPEYEILVDEQLLRSIHSDDPASLLDDINNWLRYPYDSSAISGLLNDYDIKGTHIPSWISNPASFVVSDQITKTEFGHIIQYLSDKNMLN